MRRGIGVEGVASEIGALGRDDLAVEYNRLIDGLCRRFGSTKDEARWAVNWAIEVGAIVIEENIVKLVQPE